MRARPILNLRIRSHQVRLGERTLIMGVLNVTPDSFSDGGLYLDRRAAVARGLELARAGADWIDVGGESTRPGSAPVPEKEELDRVIPVIRDLRQALDAERLPPDPNLRAPTPVIIPHRKVEISIDTTKAGVAEAAVRAGASIINDVSGLRFDTRIADVAREFRTALVLMHLRGRPETMQKGPFARLIWTSLARGLGASVRRALNSGVHRSQLLIDPGTGFGKTRRQNYQILAGLRRLHRFRLPVLVGTSRKSFVQAIVAGEGLNPPLGRTQPRHWSLLSSSSGVRDAPGPVCIGDAAAAVATILGGAHVVRVHDVKAVLPAIRIADAILLAADQNPNAVGLP